MHARTYALTNLGKNKIKTSVLSGGIHRSLIYTYLLRSTERCYVPAEDSFQPNSFPNISHH